MSFRTLHSGSAFYAKADMARHFAGVALEIEPRLDFVKIKAERKGSLLSLLKSIRGLESSLTQILIVSFGVSVLSLMLPIILQVALDVVLPQFDLDLLAIVSIVLRCLRPSKRSGFGCAITSFCDLQRSSKPRSRATSWDMPSGCRCAFSRTHPGDIVARLDSIHQVKQFLANGLVVAFTESIMSLMVLGLMFYYSPTLTGFVVATLVILMFLRMVSFPALKEASNASLVAHSEERSKLLDGLRRADTLKVHNAADHYTARWFESFVHFANHDFRSLSIQLRADLALHVLMAACTVLTLYFGITAVMQSEMSVGMLYAFFALRTSFFDKMDHLVRELLHFSVLSVHLQRIEEMTQEAPSLCGKRRASSGGSAARSRSMASTCNSRRRKSRSFAARPLRSMSARTKALPSSAHQEAGNRACSRSSRACILRTRPDPHRRTTARAVRTF